MLHHFHTTVRQWISKSVRQWSIMDAKRRCNSDRLIRCCKCLFHHIFKSLVQCFGCKITTKFPKNNGFQILWQHVADSCSGCLGWLCSKGAFLAVILHPKGKAMDDASISFREEQGLMFRKGLDFPNSFHSGWGQLLTKANSNPP